MWPKSGTGVNSPSPVAVLSSKIEGKDLNGGTSRDIFALSSVLERRGMNCAYRHDRGEAMAVLQSNPDIAIMLLDIMMPGMDGYETMGAIS
jgi:hypothetical protein